MLAFLLTGINPAFCGNDANDQDRLISRNLVKSQEKKRWRNIFIDWHLKNTVKTEEKFDPLAALAKQEELLIYSIPLKTEAQDCLRIFPYDSNSQKDAYQFFCQIKSEVL